MRVEKPRQRASKSNSRASSRATSNLASSPLEPIYRSRTSRSRSSSSFVPYSPVATPYARVWACMEDGDPGPGHVSSESVVMNLNKSYKAYFKNLKEPSDKSFEPEKCPVVEMEYPNTGATEKFLLLAPKDKDHYNPIMDLEKTLYTIVDHYLTPSQRELIGSVPNELLTEAVSPPPSPSPSPPNSRISNSSSRSSSMSSLTSLESSSDNSRPRVNYCRAVQRAINTKDGPLLVRTLDVINTILRSFKYPKLPSDIFEPAPPNALKQAVETWGSLPPKRCVGPNIARLRDYKAFSSNVYGELNPNLVEEIVSTTKLKEGSLFMDLGSGVGNVVVQAALQTGCKSFGVELSEGPAQVARVMKEQFKIRCRMWGVACGEIELEEGDMLESKRVAELIPQADVVLVDNKVFEEKLNEALRPKFLDLKEGAIVISLKPFVSSLNGLNARVTERNVDDISAIFDVTERPYYPGSVSWGNGGGSYYLHRVDRVGYAEIRQKFENTTRGRRSAASAKYVPSRNTDESDWFGQ
ncbi:S-adenosyl-L-methionine-dependent methyltransferase [Rhodocollybia butyracea]|uniref:Histone-lysine N-methyltransferase, H3 lysine-79 specific n=1 Tax=Rhodocollybia butyracea TaxID=206335 RepID=A0A9P5UCC0_9AGAR|nr:S-adenosyl-L-methionine-dependent methyltransferase [Rhodocollybia butyracea]